MASVLQLLEAAKLDAHWPLFEELGYDSLESLLEMTPEEEAAMMEDLQPPLRRGHCVRLGQALRKARQAPETPPPPPSTEAETDQDLTAQPPAFQWAQTKFCPVCCADTVAASHCGAPAIDLAAAARAEARLRPGDAVRGFVIKEPLASGGMGEALLAEHRGLGYAAVVKTVLHSLPAEALRQALARFQREARFGNELSHPNIAKVSDYGQDPASGAVFLVVEHVAGRPARGPMAPAAVVALLRQVLAALAAMHAAGILHRDIKPDNVLLCANGSVKVIDLGISKRVGDAEYADVAAAGADSGLTSASGGLAPMTVQYAAPERLRAGADVDARADLWSVGVMAHELLTGERPFQRGTLLQTACAVDADALPPTGTPLDPLLQRACAKDPAARFASAAEMAAALDLPPALAGWRRYDNSTLAPVLADLEQLRASAAAPDAPLALLETLGRFEVVELRQHARAEALLQRALALAPEGSREQASAQAALGKVRAVSDPPAARALLEAALATRARLGLSTAATLVELAVYVHRTGDAADAEAMLARAEAQGADEAHLCLARGVLLHGSDRAAARAAYERCIALREPRDALTGVAHHCLGRVLLDAGDRAGARAAFERGIAVREARGTLSGSLHLALGMMLMRDDVGGAAAALARCVAIREAQGTLKGDELYYLASVVRNSDPALARASLERSVAMAGSTPTSPTADRALLLLGHLLKGSDDAGARAAYERCIALREARGALTGDAHFSLGLLLDDAAALARCVEIREARGQLKGEELAALARRQTGAEAAATARRAGDVLEARLGAEDKKVKEMRRLASSS